MNKIAVFFLLSFAVQTVHGQSTLFRDNGPSDPVKLEANMTKSNFVPGVILVRFKDGASVTPGESQGLKKTGLPTIDAIFQQYEVTSVAKVFKNAMPLEQPQTLKSFNGYTFQRPSLHNIYKLTVKDPSKQFDAIQALRGDPNVVYAEPDYIYSIVDDKPESGIITPQGIQEYLNEHGDVHHPKSPNVVSPGDPLYSQQWAIPAVHADAVWDTTTGDLSQIIAFLDTGVDWHHPDLTANIWINTAEADGVAGIDDDHDGYVDDIHGWDFINNDNDPSDDNSHGTHVAGIACAVGNNGIGIAGVDWHARIMPVKVFQSNGQGDVATITQGIYYAAMKGATVINMSFGSYAKSLTMENALQYAYAQCVLVAAAGNDGASIYPPPLGPFYPAAFSFVLGVQAGDALGNSTPPGFSNYDPDGPIYSAYSDLLNYELKAPGSGIISTVPNGNYRVYSGTSMATPIVAGCVALYELLHPGESQELMLGNLINTEGTYIDIFSALNVSGEPKLSFVSNTVVDTLDGDGDGRVDAGETIQLWFTLRNTWAQSDSVFVSIGFGEYEDTSIAQILIDKALVGSISPYAIRTNEHNPLEIHFNSNITNNRNVVFEASTWGKGSSDTVKQEVVLTVENGTQVGGIISSNTVWTPDRLYLVKDNLRVASGVTLTILPGTHIVFYQGKLMDVWGTLIAAGVPDSLIDVSGYPSGTGEGIQSNQKPCKLFLNYTKFHDMSVALAINWGGDSVVIKNCIFTSIVNVAPTLYGSPVLFERNIVTDNPFGGYQFLIWLQTSPLDYYTDNLFIRNGGLDRFAVYGVFDVRDPQETFCGNSIFGNLGAGVEEDLYVDGNVDYAHTGLNYWGRTDSLKIKKTFNDFIVRGSGPASVVTPYLNVPSDSSHGHVWKVLIDGIDPLDSTLDAIGVGPHRFDVYFNRPMDTTYAPQLSFGVRDPFDQQAVADSAHWSSDHKIWTAYKTVKLYTGDGINTVRVATARDPEGFEIPIEDRRFNFLIDAAGTESVDFAATPGLGKVQLDWVKPDLPDILGYNMYRFNNMTDTTYSDTTLISTKLVTDTTYTDFNVTPGTNYYYAYKVVSTDFTESDYSKFVGTKALTSNPGDANGDFTVNVLDVISDVSYILGQNPQPFIFAAADVNDDSVINVLDVIGTINLILHPSPSMVKGSVAAASTSKSSQQDATLNLVNDKIWLDSPLMVAGIQLRFAGCTDTKLLSSLEGLDGLEVSSAKLRGDTAVVLAYSMKGNFIPKGKIALLRSGAEGIHLVSAVLSSSDGKSISVKLYNNGVPVVPETFTLFQNYPNPFNPTTTIRYGLPKDANGVQLVICDILGRQVRVIEQGTRSKGYHEVIWDGRNSNGISVASGVYFCQFRVRDGGALRIIGVSKMMMLK